MSEFHFRLYFSPFWIKTQLSFFFLKMATGGHFGCPKFIFVGISRHFGSKHSFHFFSENGRRWPFWMSEIYFRLHFSPFRIKTQFSFFFMKMAAGGHFGCPKFIFICISRHFRSKCNFHFFFKMAAGDHFRRSKFIFVCISRHFRSKRNFHFFSKWPKQLHEMLCHVCCDHVIVKYTCA